MLIRVRMAQLAFGILLLGGLFGGAGAPADWKSEAVPFSFPTSRELQIGPDSYMV